MRAACPTHLTHLDATTIDLSGKSVTFSFLSIIWGSHGSEYEDGCLLGCSAVLIGITLPPFQRSVLPPPSRRWVYTALQPTRQPSSIAFCLLLILPSVWKIIYTQHRKIRRACAVCLISLERKTKFHTNTKQENLTVTTTIICWRWLQGSFYTCNSNNSSCVTVKSPVMVSLRHWHY
jgi:hypothetical protein